jgi:hypothetical protein
MGTASELTPQTGLMSSRRPVAKIHKRVRTVLIGLITPLGWQRASARSSEQSRFVRRPDLPKHW